MMNVVRHQWMAVEVDIDVNMVMCTCYKYMRESPVIHK